MKCSLFFGIFFIVLGASIIIKTIFGIDLPVVKMLLAAFFIYLGVSMIVGFRICNYQTFSYCSTGSSSASEGDVNVAFGNRTIDLAHYRNVKNMKINAAFGTITIKYPQDMVVLLSINAVMSSVILPNGDTMSLGTYTYKTDPNKPEDIQIQANVGFGKLELVKA